MSDFEFKEDCDWAILQHSLEDLTSYGHPPIMVGDFHTMALHEPDFDGCALLMTQEDGSEAVVAKFANYKAMALYGHAMRKMMGKPNPYQVIPQEP